MTRQEYPEWASVAIVTKNGEPQSFVSQFSTWPHADLRLAAMATELKLPELEAVQHSSAGRVKVSTSRLEQGLPLPLGNLGKGKSPLRSSFHFGMKDVDFEHKSYMIDSPNEA